MQNNQNCANTFSTTDMKNEAMKEIFQLLAEGEIKLCNQPKIENATLVLGNTGAGKSVFTRRIAGYGATLKSVEEGFDYAIVNPNEESDTKSFIASNTIYPELLQDHNTGAYYYDFPGFLDTRGAANDITTTYFIKRTIDNVKRVKLLLLINHTSLSNQGTRDDFISLLSQATKLIKNIDKYKDGIILIATKIQYPQKTDEDIISTIAKFIKKAQNDLQQKGKSSVDNTNVLKLLDIILQQDGNTYPKIAISRSPDRKGLLNEIPIVQENTIKIQSILTMLKFVEKHDSDFGYIIPKKSLIDVSNVLNEINHSIAAGMRELGKKLQEYLIFGESKLYDISKLYNVTSLRYDEIRKMKENADNQNQVEKCVQKVLNGVASMNVNSIHQNTSTLLIKYADFSTFLHKLSDHAINDEFKCADGLQDVIEYSRRTKIWYNFLNKLYERLSDYEIQKDTSKSPCSAFDDLVTESLENKNDSEFKLDPLVLKKCFPNYELNFEEITNMKVDKSKLIDLGKVLNFTLKSDPSYSCDSNKLVIKGHYFKLGDLSIIQKRYCEGMPKYIEIFALSKIFINEDLHKIGEIAQLSIISPIWEVWGVRKITLDGDPGKMHYPAKAAEGTNPGDRGFDGMPGLPGGQGGNFLGIGETFTNLQGLHISVRGGKGGRGQNGGDGKSGRNGDDAYDDTYILHSVYNKSMDKWQHELGSQNFIMKKTERGDIILIGHYGQAGGDGGNGGRGGLGGNSGEIIFGLSGPSYINNVNKITGTGWRGSDGEGGEGATGGKQGNNFRKFKLLLSDGFISLGEKSIIKNDYRAARGNRGEDGYTETGTQHPKQSERVLTTPGHEYKNYIKENLKRSVREFYLTEFLHKLKNDTLFQNHRKRRDINHSDHKQITDHRHVLVANNIASSHTAEALKPSNKKAESKSRRTHENINETNHFTPDKPIFVKSAGARIHSPINSAIHVVRNFFGQWILFGGSIMMNYGLVKAGIGSMIGDSKSSGIHTNTERNTDRAINLGNFNINESLMLADFAIRCITKQKFYNREGKSVDLVEVKASVLSIITEFEEILSGISAEYNLSPESLEFDPVTLMSKLENEVINKNCQGLGKILYQSIEKNIHLENPQSRGYLLCKIDEMLQKKTKYSEEHYIEDDNLEAFNTSRIIRMEPYNNLNLYQLEVNHQRSFEQITVC
ncbi:uncharacterized protein LOC135837486 [Planococcus citri]|uniref:uncharacterized protein LOC135837486 n=1 Tax=Planococcus citri TaxID=170843 RepID=UPI0031FA1425